MMFIQKPNNNTNLSPALRQQQVNALVFDLLNNELLLTLTEAEDRLCMIESLAVQRSQCVRGHCGSGQRACPVTCNNCGKLGQHLWKCKEEFNSSTPSCQDTTSGKHLLKKYKKALQCFMCGVNQPSLESLQDI